MQTTGVQSTNSGKKKKRKEGRQTGRKGKRVRGREGRREETEAQELNFLFLRKWPHGEDKLQNLAFSSK